MERITYDKLIRDRIPEIIGGQGKPYAVEVMPEAEYRQALATKLVEEATEAQQATVDKVPELAKEIADLYEVVDAIIRAYGLNETEIRELQIARREQRGGFEKRLRLMWVDEPYEMK